MRFLRGAGRHVQLCLLSFLRVVPVAANQSDIASVLQVVPHWATQMQVLIGDPETVHMTHMHDLQSRYWLHVP